MHDDRRGATRIGRHAESERSIARVLRKPIHGKTALMTAAAAVPLTLTIHESLQPRYEGSHHARSGLALNGGHIRRFVVGLPWPGRDSGTLNELPNADNNVAVCHRQSDRGTAWRRRRTGKE
jgi:hypothetical protein